MQPNETPAPLPFTFSTIEQLHHENEMAFNNCTEGIIITDCNQVITRVNPGFSQITGYDSTEAIGKKPGFLKSHRHDDVFYLQIANSLKSTGKWQGEIWNRRKNGEIYSQWLMIFRSTDDKQKCRYIGIFTDLTGYAVNDTPGRNYAYYDSLTGLPNRMLLYDRLTFMLNLARRRKGIMGVLQLDLNRFKIINDTLGYVFGDQLLQNVAQRLRACTREVDSVFRLGDDGFAVLLDDILHTQDAARVAKRILSACSQPFLISDKELFITVSIGVSLFPGDGDQFELLLKNAETAMLRAKELGISNYQHYKPSMNTQAFEQLTLEHNLQKALKKNQFLVFYQPIIDLRTREIRGAEALVRWNHPELGMISPVQFIPLAEEIGLIIPIGEWVLETACRQMRLWQQQFNKESVISVNLSGRQFQQQDLATSVDRILKLTEFDARNLKLEITESIGMNNPEQTYTTLNKLKEMGILIAIDDFGTGYSSLSYLNRFPIDTLKIDRSFVMEMSQETPESAIVDAILAMAHSLDLSVIAEGVETPDQASYLLAHGCEEVQGFYFSKPVCAEEFTRLLKQPPWLASE
jgi:diguanylate cyclase (GGDEF)-like protein/PAS domain S-box-containing protein